MAMDIPTLRKLVALDENDPLSRFALGKKLFEESQGDCAAACSKKPPRTCVLERACAAITWRRITSTRRR